MDFIKSLFRQVSPYLKKTERVVIQEIGRIIWFIKGHYTWLSVLVLGILGGIWVFWFGWICRYSRYDWWRWKKRAVIKFVFYVLTLCVARILVLSL